MPHFPTNSETSTSSVSRESLLISDAAPVTKNDEFRDSGSVLPNESEFPLGGGPARELPRVAERNKLEEGVIVSTPTVDERANPLKILYLHTTFPILSETFVQREVRVLKTLPTKLELYSLWGGESSFEGLVVNKFPKWKLVTLFWWLPYWLFQRPLEIFRLLRFLRDRPVPSLLDFGMTFIGISFALCNAYRLSREENRPDIIHATWANMPGTAAQLLSLLIDVPFTFQANAHDIFRHGGDWLLRSKLSEASLVITATEYALSALKRVPSDKSNIIKIRRGLDKMPRYRDPRECRDPLRLLSVGRLIEKKGYLDQLHIYASLKKLGVSFNARIVGSGPQRKLLESRVNQLGLQKEVTLLGSQPYESVLEQLYWADIFVFTGKHAVNGDRDGFPNVIGEAMAVGVPVVSTAVAGVPEAIDDGVTGTLVSERDDRRWCDALIRLRDDENYYQMVRQAARRWAIDNFDATTNTKEIFHALSSITEDRSIRLKSNEDLVLHQ
jgi:glycosyltransferase involved in cell wall biosynthesis